MQPFAVNAPVARSRPKSETPESGACAAEPADRVPFDLATT